MSGGYAGQRPHYLTDANLNLHIVAGLRRRQPTINILTAQDIGLLKTPDPEVLAVAKAEDRILLTHDRANMPGHLNDLLLGLPADEHSPGVMSVEQALPIGLAIDAILFVWMASTHEEWRGQFTYLPL